MFSIEENTKQDTKINKITGNCNPNSEMIGLITNERYSFGFKFLSYI
jgi:hypothetical protein